MRTSFHELKNLYIELITTIVPGPASWTYFLPILLLPLGLLVPPSTLSHGTLCAFIITTSVVATAHAWFVSGGNDVISTDCLYLTLFLYFFKDPRRDFRRIIRHDELISCQLNGMPKHADKKEEETVDVRLHILEAYPETFSGRLAWAMILPQSRPLHDWIIGNPGHDRRVVQNFQHPSRLGFMKNLGIRLLPVFLFFLPLSKQLAGLDPYFRDPTWSSFHPVELDVSEEGVTANLIRAILPLFMLRPLVMAMYAYSLLIMLFLPPMLIAVLLNAAHIIPTGWSPHTWRPHFGPFSAISRYGVRGFWGRWWHQQMRHIVSEPGRWFAAKLGLEDHGWQKILKYMLICVSAFMLSGITHSGLVPPKPRFATVEANQLRLELASFFWVQPIGIAAELFLLEPVLRLCPMRYLRECVRTVWTLMFMCFSCTFLVTPFGQLGYWNVISSQYLLQLP